MSYVSENINTPKKIRDNAHFILSYYRRLSRLTGGFENEDTLMAMEIVQGSYSEAMPLVPLKTPKEYRAEKLAMIRAWQQLTKKHREILYLVYFNREPRKMREIACLLNRSPTSTSERKATALEAFAETYKDGILKTIE